MDANAKLMRVLLIDDDSVALEQSRCKIALYVPEQFISTAQNSLEVMQLLKSETFQLVFIDVEMPDTDGFSVADYVHETPPNARYVFLTGHTELGAKSYEYEPLDFLCKPLDALRLKKTFERYEKSVGRFTSDQLAVECANGFALLSPAEILYITRESRRTFIVGEGFRYAARSSLEELELMFGDYGLFRCHQSYLVALSRVKSVTQASFGKTYQAILANGEKIPVSRGRYAALREQLEHYGVFFV